MSDRILNNVYESINHVKKSYGYLIKTELHIHTPASHDYQLVPGRRYSDMGEGEVIEESVKRGLYNDSFIEHVEDGKKESFVEDINREFNVDFSCFKELFAYQLIAHTLYENDIEAAIISDHNTIKGFKKLQAAIVDYYKSRLKGYSDKKCIFLFLGVEISCSDHYHLVAIFDNHDYGKVNEFLRTYIHSEEEGTYISCLDMVKRVSEQNGIPYIAHVNSSEFHGTNLYQKSLFGAEELFILGLTNIEKESVINNKLNGIQGKLSERYCFLHEGDSHNLNEIGIKNTWIKFNKVNFKSLKKSLANYEYSIYTQKPTFNDRFIKGMYILPEENSFLTNKDNVEQPFVIDFSRDLNCLIGGRGVGKSTVLNIMETAFTLEYKNREYLRFISQHKTVYIVFYYRNNDYILRFLPQVGERSSYIKEDFFLEKAFSDSTITNDGNYTLAPHWVSLYKVSNHNKTRSFTEVDNREKDNILSEVYKKSYSINNIIERINSGNISKFIKEVTLNGNKFSESSKIISDLQLTEKRKYRKYLRNNLNDIIKKIEKRKDVVHKAIDEFNIENKNLLEIIHSPKEEDPSIYVNELNFHFNDQLESRRNILNTYLTWDDAENFLFEAIKQFGYLDFLNLLLNKQHRIIEKHLTLNDFISDTTSGEFEYINSVNVSRVYNKIEARIFRDTDSVTRSIRYLLQVVDQFSLNFNVNSKESVATEKVVMKNIENLSLGQKVVAILTFLFNYGEHSNDSTPLVIDQPEDNLDNIYIYQNLVKSLRRIKNKRQVIVSTHSATIVTNADAEQVLILESDNEHGWLVKKGYPDDKVVLNHIVAILEGGQNSFLHKKDTYSTVLNL